MTEGWQENMEILQYWKTFKGGLRQHWVDFSTVSRFLTAQPSSVPGFTIASAETSSDETSKEVIKMRYFSEGKKVKTFKEIADHFGVSTQTVVNWHDKFLTFLKNKLKSESSLDII